MTKRFNAFTLAEVLITLGIIGVVAAMTMPTLMNSTNGAQYKAAYKKALSALGQAITLNVALDDVSFADIDVAGTAGSVEAKGKNGSGEDAKDATGSTVGSVLNSRMNIVKHATNSDYGYTSFPDVKPCTKAADADESSTTCTEGDAIAPDTFLFFNDGIMFAYKAADAVGCKKDVALSVDKPCYGVIDVNGTKGPNKVIACDDKEKTDEANCTVSNPTDIYPVEFYNQTVLPASPAAKAVLYGK